MSLNNKDTMFHQFRVSGTLLFPTLHSRTYEFRYFISDINISWTWSIIREGKELLHGKGHFSHKIQSSTKTTLFQCIERLQIQNNANAWTVLQPLFLNCYLALPCTNDGWSGNNQIYLFIRVSSFRTYLYFSFYMCEVASAATLPYYRLNL